MEMNKKLSVRFLYYLQEQEFFNEAKIPNKLGIIKSNIYNNGGLQSNRNHKVGKLSHSRK